jgi:hypothetical protein
MHRNQDVRIEKGHEYTEKYVFQLPADTTDFKRSCDIWVYRWEQPGRFVTYPGTSCEVILATRTLMPF